MLSDLLGIRLLLWTGSFVPTPRPEVLSALRSVTVTNDSDTADALFRGLAAAAGDDAPLFLDVPEPNAEAESLAHRYAMQPVFATARMYRGGASAEDVGRVYGVTTFEFG